MKTSSKKKSSKKNKKGPTGPAAGVRSTVVTAPVAKTTVERSSGPKMSMNRNGAIRVTRREFVGTVTNADSTTFSLDANSIASPGWDFNPSNSTLFPWLSIMAPSYERYKFHSLAFELVSSQATSTAGRVYAAVDYDWDDEVPATKAQLMGNLSAQEAPVWSNLKISTDSSQLHRDMPYKYVNLGQRVSSEPRTSYAGFLIIGFDTPTANCRFDMFVTYDVTFEVPVFENVGAVLSNPVPLQPTIPYVNERTPWYDAAAGATEKVVQALWTSNVQKGLIREVVGGVGDVPTLASPGVTPFLQKALDIGRLGYQHWMTFEGYLKNSGLTPAQWSAATHINALVYSATGVHLGALMATLTAPYTGIKAADVSNGSLPSENAVAGKSLRPLMSFELSSVRSVFPGARYLVPLIYVANTLGLGDVAATVGIDYRLW